MNKHMLSKNNKGASLVLVIIAMFFVGLIASIVLSITVGNAKSTRTTVESSENFYSSEGALDDLKMYLKKLCTLAATDAYAATLEKVGLVSDIEAEFDSNFSSAIVEEINKMLNDSTKVDPSNKTMKADFLKNYVTFDREGTISIKYSDFVTTGVSAPTLKNVVVTLKNADGTESILTTDITFSASMPSTSWKDSSDSFNYGIDHFIIISSGDIKPKTDASNIGGNYTGNIYTGSNFTVRTVKETSSSGSYTSTKPLNLKTALLITGGNFNIDSGVVNISPVGNKNIMDEKTSAVWSDNIKLGNAKVEMGKVTDPDDATKDCVTEIYLRNNLELNGKSAEFKAVNGGYIYGYSSAKEAFLTDIVSDATKDIPKRKDNPSSAIILNGLGAKLDLSGLTELRIAGQAYTSLSDIDGVYNAFKNSSTEGASGYYYSQGEAITYRALQAMYLIPGDYIEKVAHNPMKTSGEFKKSESEYNITADDIKIPAALEGKLNSGVFKSRTVRYVGGENYTYLFWDFKKPEYAVEYFQSLRADNRWKAMSEAQADILGNNNGYIKLPTNKKYNANALYYSNTDNKLYMDPGTAVNIGEYANNYAGLLSQLDTDGTAGKPLLENMFKKGLAATRANDTFTGELNGPLDDTKNSAGKVVKYSEKATKDRPYTLMTGPNVTLSSIVDGMTYIIITPGNVTLPDSGNFRGMIIAGGEVYLPATLNMECLGMISRTPEVNGVVQAIERDTEFKYLLGVIVDDSKKDLANTRLRSIFGVADTSGSGGSSDGDDFSDVLFTNWGWNN